MQSENEADAMEDAEREDIMTRIGQSNSMNLGHRVEMEHSMGSMAGDWRIKVAAFIFIFMGVNDGFVTGRRSRLGHVTN